MNEAWTLAQTQVGSLTFETLTFRGPLPHVRCKSSERGLRRPRVDQEHLKLTPSLLNGL